MLRAISTVIGEIEAREASALVGATPDAFGSVFVSGRAAAFADVRRMLGTLYSELHEQDRAAREALQDAAARHWPVGS